jgi:hypothetical protein
MTKEAIHTRVVITEVGSIIDNDEPIIGLNKIGFDPYIA